MRRCWSIPHDVDAVYASLIEVLTDRMQNERLRAAGLACAAQFTWEAMARQTLAVYREVAEVAEVRVGEIVR